MLINVRMLNSEGFPKWFDQFGSSRKFAGASGKMLLLSWSLGNMIIMFAFISMLRAAMMKPVMEKSIDTTQELIKSGKTPVLTFGTFWPRYLRTSSNYWDRQAGLLGVQSQGSDMSTDVLKKEVYTDGSSAVQMMAMQVGQVLKEDQWFRDKPAPVFHFSKEVMRSFYLGWVVNKQSSWRNVINNHILRIQEVILTMTKEIPNNNFRRESIFFRRNLCFRKLINPTPMLSPTLEF